MNVKAKGCIRGIKQMLLKQMLLRALPALLALLLLLPAPAAAAAEGETVIRVGWAPRPGMTELQDGIYSGYNYDFLMEIARYTGWSYEFVTGDVPVLTAMLEKGEIDLLGTLLHSESRAQRFDFAALPYGTKYTILFTAEESSLQPYDFGAFDGMRIGVLKGDAASAARLESFASDSGFSYTLAELDGEAAFSRAVEAGEVDAGVVDAFMEEPGFRILAEFAPIPYYFAVTKGNDGVLQALNRALWQMNIDRPYMERELYEKHFGIQFDSELTGRELACIAESKSAPVTVGVIASSAPACYWDEEAGEYAGIFMEMLRTVSEKTGLQFQYVPLDLSLGAPVAQLKAGAPTLVAGIIKTQRFMDDPALSLSDVLLNDALVIVGRKSDDFSRNPESKTIVYTEGFQVAREYIAETFPLHKTGTYSTAAECLDAVSAGRADAAVYTRTCINYLLHDPHYENLEIVPAYYSDVGTCAAGLAAGAAEYISIIDKGLAMISESERNGILMDTTLLNPYRTSIGDILYKYRSPLLIITLLLLAVIGVLVALNFTKKRSERRLQAAFAKEQEAHAQEKAALALAEKASAAKGSFMSRMSHEIRTPLNAVIGYNTIARNEMTEAKTDEERRQAEMKVMDCLLKSDMASKHLLTIINDVLDMSAIESGRILIAKERFDFKGMIASLTAIFYTQAKTKGVNFETVFDTLTEEWLVGDQMRVNQILTNLLSNAVKFTPKGGTVKLTVSQPALQGDEACIRFAVSDTGIGMTEEYLGHIWTPFEQADSSISRRFGGTGLGLSITKNLVDLMNGSIAVQSEQGVGTTFVVDLSFVRTEQPKNNGSYDFSRINALIVDDDAGTCDYIRLLFNRCGARCAAVTSGADALEAFALAQGQNEPYTVCLVDWRMPNMDGIETIQHIRSMAGADLPIIVITAYDFTEIAERAAEVGVSMFIAKPLFQSSLFNLLANLCGRPAAVKPEKADAYHFAPARLLLAEDNAMNMEIARKILETAGLRVDGVWNGQEAVSVFENAPAGTYQAILMDVQMPVMDGHEATRTIRASAHPEAETIPIIAMTADAFAENIAESRASGMNDHVSKPIDIPTLFTALEKYLPKMI